MNDMTTPTMLFVLGNPEPQRQFTRHNVAWLLADALRTGPYTTRGTHQTAPSAEGLIVRPLTGMNTCGAALADALTLHGPHRLVVIYDDLDLPLLTADGVRHGAPTPRWRQNGSSGGHNGVKSVIDHLGTSVFTRLKLPIGAPPPDPALSKAERVTRHVLGPFRPDEHPHVAALIATAALALRSPPAITTVGPPCCSA